MLTLGCLLVVEVDACHVLVRATIVYARFVTSFVSSFRPCRVVVVVTVPNRTVPMFPSLLRSVVDLQ